MKSKALFVFMGIICIGLMNCGEQTTGSQWNPDDFNKSPGQVTLFTANPTTIKKGESSTLKWQTFDAEKVEINQGIGEVPIAGTKQVSPTVTTTYKCTATSRDGSNFKECTVTVTE
ncbi:MAG: hypothetical protein GQ559_02990 [Desulfobulbaceae bacterium]|nr:hypothetical protein [Desulfobulbaceae bacterium]